MRRELLVPKLGLTMSEGVLVEWMVQPGESFVGDGPSVMPYSSVKSHGATRPVNSS